LLVVSTTKRLVFAANSLEGLDEMLNFTAAQPSALTRLHQSITSCHNDL
jgi:hypothetical protein